MNELIRAALVIARRDYVASVWSRTFLLFLIGPLFPILFAMVFGSIGARVDSAATHPTVAVIAADADREILTRAHRHIAERLGAGVLPDLRLVAPAADLAGQTRRLLKDETTKVAAVLVRPLTAPHLIGPASAIDTLRGDLALVLDQARQDIALRATGSAPAPVTIALDPVRQSAGTSSSARLLTARAAQLVLVMLTMILAGMLLSNLIEEKSNKVIEVLAAAVPVDAIFLGKLIAMLGMSLTGIAVWGSVATLAVVLLAPGAAGLPPPAVGWPAFVGLGVAYFIASYLLLGAAFLGIGAQASSVREVQTLSMPVTMGQLVVFAFASSAVGDPGSGTAIAATIFPWSSPFAMLARAAQLPTIWPHLLAMLWQALWVAIIIRFAARRFRISVLKSGGGRGFFRRRAVKSVVRQPT
ncbi:MAG: transporter permease [Sphingomonas bacterium]|nr:transporter permease [Sphingomonas bacterium]